MRTLRPWVFGPGHPTAISSYRCAALLGRTTPRQRLCLPLRPNLTVAAARQWRQQRPQLSRCYHSSPDHAPPSIVFGPTSPPLLAQTIPEHFASVVAQYGDRPAVVCRAASVAEDAVDDSSKETVYTYAQLDAASTVLARGLRAAAGVRKGERVAVSLGNGPEFAVLTYALYKLGAVLVPLNPAFTAAQVAAALRHLDAAVLVMGAVTDLPYKPGRGRSNLALLSKLLGGEGEGEGAEEAKRSDVFQHPSMKLRSPAVPSLRGIVLVDNRGDHLADVCSGADFAVPALTPWSVIVAAGEAAEEAEGGSGRREDVLDPSLAPDEVINIQFTSGTTSQPKAAMLTHTAILNNGALVAQRMGLASTDRVVCPPPLFHCFGSVLGYMATATTGAALLLPSPAFDPAASLRMAADHAATALYGVATMYVAMLELLEAEEQGQAGSRKGTRVRRPPAPPMRTGIAAGSSVPEALMRRLADTLGLHELVICYGMTETAPVSCMTAPDDPLALRTATVGRVMPHTAVKIVDPADRSRIVPRGTPGELAVSGYLLMQGYWGDEARTKEVLFADDASAARGCASTKGRLWMYSGDEACMDADGYVAVTGRIKDLIIRGGENIHPLEIENCLFQHPLVAEVSVVGVPDERYGEAVAAFVVPHAGVCVTGGLQVPGSEWVAAGAGPRLCSGSGHVLSEDAVRAWVADHLSPHLVPKYIFWLAEYPKTASGKIQKFKLRDTAKGLIG